MKNIKVMGTFFWEKRCHQWVGNCLQNTISTGKNEHSIKEALKDAIRTHFCIWI